MKEYEFPLIELQTNGIAIAEKPEKYLEHLRMWYTKGMTTIAISIVHYEPEQNRIIYVPYKNRYIGLPKLIAMLHELGFSVRLTCIGARGFIDDLVKLRNLIDFAKKHKVEQLTLTPVNKPDHPEHQEAWEWTNKHHLLPDQLTLIIEFLEGIGSHILTLSHGAKVYDVDGQNICLNHCLTVQPNKEEMRNLIFYPDGHLRYYWQYPGAIIC